MKRVSIFGATGSIGQNTISLIDDAPEAYDVTVLTGAHNVAQLAADAERLSADIAITSDESRYDDLKDALAGTGVEVAAGRQALLEAAERPADWFMSAIVGAAGLEPGFRALQHCPTLALANKESLVTAGPLLLAEARRTGSAILPVDSEHSAVFQALVGEEIAAVEQVIITASGGGLRDWPLEELERATPEDAGAHPNWEMGQRITIDSASMFNKAMELIEAKELFGLRSDQIEAVIHPQSLVHALVCFVDGAMMSHIGPHDMRHAIGYALHYPQRRSLPVARVDLAKQAVLEFREPCLKRYPALGIARQVMETGGGSGSAFNAAKEIALDGFLARQIGFIQMNDVVAQTLDAMSAEIDLAKSPQSLEEVLQIDHMSRQTARTIIDRQRQ